MIPAGWRPILLAVMGVLIGTHALDAQPIPWPSERPPRPLPARDVTFPPYAVRTLDNGLQVVAVSHHEQPIVSMRLILRAGAAYDPPGKAGVAMLTASLLSQGTTTSSASAMNEAIDFIGGSMDAGSGTDLTFVNVLVMKDGLDAGLRMLSDMTRQPAFAQEEIERQRAQALSSRRVSLEDPEFVADAVFDRLVYGVHPYGLPQGGTPDTLGAVTRDDLVAFHARYFVPNNAILAIVGDISVEDAFAGVQKVFGDWSRRALQRPAFTAPPDPARRVVIIDKPDAVQTEVRAGHLGVRRNNSDYMALNLTLRILGGEGANRLHQVLRTERGLTYGAKADMDTLFESGDFEASTNTRSEATGEVLRLMVDEFWRLQRERVGERELADAKAYITGSFPLTIETPDAIATQVLNVLFFGLPVEQLQSFRQRVNAVGTDDIERVARYYLRPDRLCIVLVGNASAFLPQLRKLGFNNFDVIPMADLDLLAVDLRKRRSVAATAGGARVGERPARTPADQASGSAERPGPVVIEDLPTERALLARMIAAKGGLERLRRAKSLTARTRVTSTDARGRPVALDVTTYLEYSGRVRIESAVGAEVTVQVYDGVRGWTRDARGVHDVSDAMVRDFRSSLQRDTIAALLAANDGRLTMRQLLDSRDDAGRLRYQVEFSSPGFDPVVWHVDPETLLVTRQIYVSAASGRPVVEESFADYRVVDGIAIAFAASITIGGETVLERRVLDIAIGGPLNPDLFERPAS